MKPGDVVIVHPRRLHSAEPWRALVVRTARGTVRTGPHFGVLSLSHVGSKQVAVRPLEPWRGFSAYPVIVPADIVTPA